MRNPSAITPRPTLRPPGELTWADHQSQPIADPPEGTSLHSALTGVAVLAKGLLIVVGLATVLTAVFP